MTARPAAAYEQWLARLEMTFAHRQQKTKGVTQERKLGGVRAPTKKHR